MRDGFPRRVDSVEVSSAREERLQFRRRRQGELVGHHAGVRRGCQAIASAEFVARFDKARESGRAGFEQQAQFGRGDEHPVAHVDESR